MLPMPLAIYNNPYPFPPVISIPLVGISEVEVLAAEVNEQGELIISVASLVESVVCHKCQGVANKGHGADEAVSVIRKRIRRRACCPRISVQVCPRRSAANNCSKSRCPSCPGEAVGAQGYRSDCR